MYIFAFNLDQILECNTLLENVYPLRSSDTELRSTSTITNATEKLYYLHFIKFYDPYRVFRPETLRPRESPHT